MTSVSFTSSVPSPPLREGSPQDTLIPFLWVICFVEPMGMTFRPAFAVASLLSSGSLSIFPEVLTPIPQFSESTLIVVCPCFRHILLLWCEQILIQATKQ